MMSPAADPRAPRVAIVDDEEDVLTFLRLALEDQGYEVLACDRPGGALELLAEFEPDLICLDLLMPERMGVSLYVDIRKSRRLATVPVLILSGLNAREGLLDILRRESDVPAPSGYLEKPVGSAQFLAAVQDVLGTPAGARP
jgi:DNA-binding response OmpR family regulator